jgi:hypothetical protein
LVKRNYSVLADRPGALPDRLRLLYLTSGNTFNALIAVDIGVTIDRVISAVDVQGRIVRARSVDCSWLADLTYVASLMGSRFFGTEPRETNHHVHSCCDLILPLRHSKVLLLSLLSELPK